MDADKTERILIPFLTSKQSHASIWTVFLYTFSSISRCSSQWS